LGVTWCRDANTAGDAGTAAVTAEGRIGQQPVVASVTFVRSQFTPSVTSAARLAVSLVAYAIKELTDSINGIAPLNHHLRALWQKTALGVAIHMERLALIRACAPACRASGLIRELSALVLGLAFTSSPAVAQPYQHAFHSGNSLLEMCSHGQYSADNSYCLGYIAGMADAIDAANGSLLGWRACPPNEATEGQIMDVVVQFLSQHPESRHYTASSQIARALANAFPCS
jgi:hypothetical protein